MQQSRSRFRKEKLLFLKHIQAFNEVVSISDDLCVFKFVESLNKTRVNNLLLNIDMDYDFLETDADILQHFLSITNLRYTYVFREFLFLSFSFSVSTHEPSSKKIFIRA